MFFFDQIHLLPKIKTQFIPIFLSNLPEKIGMNCVYKNGKRLPDVLYLKNSKRLPIA